MLDRVDLAYSVLQVLYAFYWVMVDIRDALEDAAGKASEGLRFHLMLASKRCNVIIEHLRMALEEAGVKPDERLGEEELLRRIGALSIETLENIRSTLKGLIGDLASGGKREVSWLISKLMEFADVIYIAVGLLRAFSDSLKESRNEHVWRTSLILRTIAQDLEVIANAHRYLASNPEMLARDLKTHDY